MAHLFPRQISFIPGIPQILVGQGRFGPGCLFLILVGKQIDGMFADRLGSGCRTLDDRLNGWDIHASYSFGRHVVSMNIF